MATVASTIIEQCIRELRDTAGNGGNRYTRESLLLKLWEALYQFSDEAEILRIQNYVLVGVLDQEIYSMPSDFLRFEEIYFGKSPKPLQMLEAHPRNRYGSARYQRGTPIYTYTDGLDMLKIGIWPAPDSNNVPDTPLTPGVNTITADTDLTGHLVFDYIRSAALPSPLVTNTANTSAGYTNDANIDTDIPDIYLDKLYLLVCHLRLIMSDDTAERDKAAIFLQRYRTELLSRVRVRKNPNIKNFQIPVIIT